MITEKLVEFGLTKNEASFLEGLYRYGGGNAAKISNKIGMDKSSAYRAAEGLISKGLVNYELGAEKTFYPNPPENIKELLYEQKNKIIRQETEADELISKIYSQINYSKITSKITLYEGLDAPQKIFETMLDDDVTIQRQTIRTDIQKFLVDISGKNIYEKWVEDYIKRRVEKKIELRYLCGEEWAGLEYTKSDKKLLKEVRVMPKDIEIETNIITGGNKFGTHTVEISNVKGIIIRDNSIVATQNSMFDYIWNKSTKK